MLSVNVKGECWVEFDVLHAKLSCSLLGRLCGWCGCCLINPGVINGCKAVLTGAVFIASNFSAWC